MPVTVKTVYTKERMLKYYYAVMRSKKLLWLVMALGTLVVLGGNVLVAMLGELDSTMLLCAMLVIVLDATYLLVGFVLPRFTVAKSKRFNAELTYTFEADHFQLKAIGTYSEETATIRYAMLTKVQKNGTELYLMIDPRQGYIVDLANLSDEEQAQLKQTLTAAIPSSLIRW